MGSRAGSSQIFHNRRHSSNHQLLDVFQRLGQCLVATWMSTVASPAQVSLGVSLCISVFDRGKSVVRSLSSEGTHINRLQHKDQRTRGADSQYVLRQVRLKGG